jgi:hypothetical protein
MNHRRTYLLISILVVVEGGAGGRALGPAISNQLV